MAGGGVYNAYGTLTLNNSIISDNTASRGGAISGEYSWVTLNNNSRLTANHAILGGAMFNNYSTVVTLNDSSITGNTVTQSKVGEGYGGGMHNNQSTVTLNNSSVSNNLAGRKGGAMNNENSTVTLNNSVISDNNATAIGGGGMYSVSSTITLNDSSVSANTASATGVGAGGGMYNNGSNISITRSTFAGNKAKQGGAIGHRQSTMVMSNSTISGNMTSSSGGGLRINQGTVALINMTITGNSATIEGGNISNSSNTPVTLSNSIVANSLGSGTDCRPQTVNNAGNNWFETADCLATPQGDPLLGPLTDNGGPTLTHALLKGSGAIDAADNTICAASPVSSRDQRGEFRPSGSRCDIGAFEFKQNDGFFVIPAGTGKTVIFGL